MKNNLPSFPPRTIRKFCAGWTLPELMIAILCATIIMASLMIITVFAARSYIAIANYNDLDRNSRNALDVMSEDIRNMSSLTSYATNAISLSATDGSSVSYNWIPSTSIFTRTYTPAGGSASTAMLLSNCTILVFHVYSRVPTNSFTFPDTSGTPSQTKLIDVSWRCTRSIFGIETNSESVQTAKIVIRN